MCGIVGAFLKEGDERFPIWNMTAAIRHRGPDDEGYVLIDPDGSEYFERGGADTRSEIRFPSIQENGGSHSRLLLGHRRLSIIDLSPAGHQPMCDRDKKFWITYNGEIYNYRELRQELKSLGTAFHTETDTEVILEAYKRWGEACLHRFNGMWAFALWDSERRILFCSRDRYGVKPFFYAHAGENFFFASEIKALLVLPGIPRDISEEALFDYLAFALHHRGSRTFFKGIHSLEPGSNLIVDSRGTIQTKRWYDFPEAIGTRPFLPESVGDFRDLFADAVRLRLRSDVRVGSCLSGGLDSSSIVCLAQKELASPIETVSSCFEDGQFDERKFIGPVIKKTGARSHFVFPDGKKFWEEWRDLIYSQEEPFGSTSVYAQWCVMREAARSGIPVLLDGQGGDELLAGYLRYRRNRAVSLMMKGDVRGFVLALANPKAFGFWGFNFLPVSLCAGVSRRLAQFSGYLDPDFLKRHISRTEEWVVERGASQRSLSLALQSDFLDYSLPALLRYEDKNSMRFSVETRLPFLDYRLVEYVFGLEDRAKIGNRTTKRILRESMRGILPEAVRLRSDKMGFVTPEHQWLQEGIPFLRGLFNNPKGSMIAPWVHVEPLIRRIEKGEGWNQFLWRVINLELWMRTFFASKPESIREHTHSQSVLSA